MRKVSLIIGLYIFLFIISNCSPYHLLIKDIRFEGATLVKKSDEKQFNDYNATSIFTNDIVFVISYNSYDALFNNLSSNCYAQYDRGHVYDNKLLEETFSIKFDHLFVYNEDTISSYQNIFDFPSIKNEIEIFDNYESFDYMGADKVISFSDSFCKGARFDTLNYNISFYCRTSDSLTFSKNISVKFRLKN
jgi:hypothetical protein